jgi:hypothetical protein
MGWECGLNYFYARQVLEVGPGLIGSVTLLLVCLTTLVSGDDSFVGRFKRELPVLLALTIAVLVELFPVVLSHRADVANHSFFSRIISPLNHCCGLPAPRRLLSAFDIHVTAMGLERDLVKWAWA